MRAEVHDSSKSVKSDLKAWLERLAVELGLTSDAANGVDSVASQVVASRVNVEKEVRNLTDKIDDFSITITNLQEKADSNDRNLRVDMRGLERRVDESTAIAGSTVSTIEQRAASLEQRFRDIEAHKSSWRNELKSEMYEKLKENYDEWVVDRSSLERRMVLAEKVVDKFSEKLETLGIKVREMTGDMSLTK